MVLMRGSATISYRSSFSLVNAYQRRVNQGLSRGKWKLKEEVVQTYMVLVKLYSKRLSSMGGVLDDPCHSMLTNGEELASHRGKDPRTIRNHRRILQELGLLKEDEWHGSRSNFRIHFEEKYLGLHHETTTEEIELEIERELEKMQTKAEIVGEYAEKNSSISDDLGTHSNLDKVGVERLTKRRRESKGIGRVHAVQGGAEVARPQDGTGEQGTGAEVARPQDGTGEQGTGAEVARHQDGIEEQGTGAEVARHQDGIEEQGTGAEVARHQDGIEEQGTGAEVAAAEKDIANKSLALFMMAKQLLYSGQTFSPLERERTIKLISGYFRRVPSAQIEYWNKVFAEMIGCAHSYVIRDPKRFVPLPWKWFDPKFKDGFIGTYAWYVRRERNHRLWRGRDALHRARQKWIKNERAYPSEKRPAQTVYLECTDSIAKHGRADLLEQWNLFIKNHYDNRTNYLAF